jgi:hypothetical protein
MNVRRMVNPSAVFTNPRQAVGIAASLSTTTIGIFGPYRSQIGPSTIRTAIVPPTPAIDEVQTSCRVRLRVFFISGSNGETANQTKKATKNENHAEWKFRIWGRARLFILISVDLSSCSGSISTSYELYFLLQITTVNVSIGKRLSACVQCIQTFTTLVKTYHSFGTPVSSRDIVLSCRWLVVVESQSKITRSRVAKEFLLVLFCHVSSNRKLKRPNEISAVQGRAAMSLNNTRRSEVIM